MTNKESNLFINLLNTKKWKTLDHIRDFLKTFYNAIKIIEDREAILDRVFSTINFLADRFERAIDKFVYYNIIRKFFYVDLIKLLKY